MIIRIRAQHAAFVIARFGSVKNLIEQIVHPLIDSTFRNNAGEKKAIEFIMKRTALQELALEKAQKVFEPYHVEAQNLLIAYIKVDEALLKTQTEKEIAIQQQEQFRQQTLAEQERVQVEAKRATASKQPEVIGAELSIKIEENKAQARVKEAEGIRDSTRIRADGDAYQAREVGKGVADAYRAASEVIGDKATALVRVVQEIGAGQVKITPDILVAGGESKQNDLLFNAWLATMLTSQEKKKKEEKSG